MSNIMPGGENLRNAVKWISEMRKDSGVVSEKELIQQACLKYNLTPLEADYLIRLNKETS